MERIIPSLIFDDLYTLTQSQAFFIAMPNLKVRTVFVDREPEREYPKDFVPKLLEQFEMLRDMKLQGYELSYLQNIRFLKNHYLEWLAGFTMDPKSINVEMFRGKPRIEAEEYAYRAVFWEMKTLLTASTLCFQDMPRVPDWQDRIEQKGETLANGKASWIDFGTRRAFAPDVQDEVVRRHKRHAPYFRGTSNVALALKHNVPVFGTVAHFWFMVFQALSGVRNSNYDAMETWSSRDLYDGDLGIALTDTLTTEVFLRNLSRKQAKLWDGFRLDSGNLLDSAKLIASFIKTAYDIDPLTKIWTPSDSLDINKTFAFRDGMQSFLNSDKAKITAGIGTFMVNDCGYKPRNIVMKPVAFNSGHGGWQSVAKLSDTTGKHMGESRLIDRYYEELGIPIGGWNRSLPMDARVKAIMDYRRGTGG